MKKENNNFYENIDTDKISELKKHLDNALTIIQKKVFLLRYDKEGNVLFSIEEIADKLNTNYTNIHLILDTINKTKERIIKINYTQNKGSYLEELRKSHKKEFIETLHKLKRLPTKEKDGKPEAIFSNGTNQMSYYKSLRAKARKSMKNLEEFGLLTEEDQKTLDDFNEIEKILNSYLLEKTKIKDKIMTIKKAYFKEIMNNLGLSNKEKNKYIKSVLLNTQYKLYCLRFDSEGNIKNDIRTIARIQGTSYQSINESLIRMYTRITKALIEDNLITINYIENMSKKDQLIESIKELHRLPHSEIDSKPERIFHDRTNQREYYNRIQKLALEYMEKEKNTTLTKEEQQTIDDYIEIKNELKKYEPKIELTEHTLELIKSINELHRLPKLNIGSTPEKTFKNGTNQRSYYNTLCEMFRINKDKNEEELTFNEKLKIYNYLEIRKVLKKYKKTIRNVIPREEKTKQLIDYIKKYKNLPPKNTTEDDYEAFFDDGTKKRVYYFNIQQKSNYLKKLKRPLTKEEQQVIDDFNEVSKVYRKIFPKNSMDERLNRLISIINKTHKFPKYERNPIDNVNYKVFLDILTRAIKRNKRKKENNIPLNKMDKRYIEMYQRVYNVKSFHQNKKENSNLIIELCTKLNIDLKQNKELLTKSFSEIYAKIKFLEENNIPYQHADGTINEIMYMSDLNMQEKYNISLEEIVNKYIFGEYDVNQAIKMIKE